MLGSCLPAGPTARRSRACRGPSRNAHLFFCRGGTNWVRLA